VQGEQRKRLMALAAQVAAESDPGKFHALVLELDKVLKRKGHPRRGQGKTSPQPPAKSQVLTRNP
jgi:hypothetical protein